MISNTNDNTLSLVRSIMAAVASEDFDRIRDVLDRDKKNVNIQNSTGYTPLHYAVNAGNYELIELLVNKYGASPMIPNRNGDTAWRVMSNEISEHEQLKISHFLLGAMQDYHEKMVRIWREVFERGQESCNKEVVGLMKKYDARMRGHGDV